MSGHYAGVLSTTSATGPSTRVLPTHADFIHDVGTATAASTPATPTPIHFILPSSQTSAHATMTGFVSTYITSNHKNSPGRLSPTIIGIIAAAGVVLLSMIAGILFFFVRRRKSQRFYTAVNKKQNHEAKAAFDIRMTDSIDVVDEEVAAAQNAGDYTHPYAGAQVVDTAYRGRRSYDPETEPLRDQAGEPQA